jgi:hypothetical protein
VPAQYRSPHPSTRQVNLLCVTVARRGNKCKTDQTTQRRKTMALKVRRIVTGHDANGKAIVKTDERLQAVSRLRAAAYRGLRDLVDRQDAGRQHLR